MSTIRVVNLQHTDATEPNIVLQSDGTSVFASGITISGGTNLTVSGTAEFASGTVSAPGITFIDDNNTGIYEPAADTVAITTAATERLRVDSAGRLGIGTTSPESYNANGDNLVIQNSDGTGSAGMTIRAGTGAQSTIYFADGTSTSAAIRGYIQYAHNGDFLRFGTDANERLRIDSSGNVGIADNGPNFKLDVNGDIGIREGNNLVFHDGGGTSAFRIRGDSSNKLHFERASNNAAQMIIDNGKVGIGTSSPANPLHIASQNPSIRLQSNAGSYQGRNTLGQYNNILYLECDNDNQVSSSAMAFTIDATERMRIDSSGQVGVGTTSPRSGIHLKEQQPTITLQPTADTESCFIDFRNAADNNSRGFIGYDLTNDFMNFRTNGSGEKMRISSTGQLLVGTTGGYSVPVSMHGDASATSTGTGSYVVMTVGDTNAGAQNVGGGIGFLGNDGVNSQVTFSQIQGFKENGTSGDYAGGLKFHTRVNAGALTERMRIASNGDVKVGANVNQRIGTTTVTSWGYDSAGNGTMVFVNLGTAGNGTFQGVSLGKSATSWGTYSDERGKTSLIPIENGLSKLSTLRAVTGRYLEDEENTSRSFLIAQDVQAILPEAVDSTDPDKLTLRYTEVIPLLVAALKEAKERIETLEAQNINLVERIEALESK